MCSGLTFLQTLPLPCSTATSRLISNGTGVGIGGAPAAGYILNVNGSMNVNWGFYNNAPPFTTGAQAMWQVTGGYPMLSVLGSSKRFKENVVDLKDDFSKILNFKPISYTLKGTTQQGIGYIAEDLDQLGLKSLVVYEADGTPYSINYSFISIYLLEVIKGQQEELKNLKEEIAKIKQGIK
jgi:hypothetical protein